MKKILFLLATFLCGISVSAQNPTDSKHLGQSRTLASGDSVRFDSLLPLALSGDCDAQVEVARCYEFGEGVAANRDSAESWYLRAANANYAPAQWSLAWFYYQNDNKKMVQWLQKASDNGWDFATTDLGTCYYDGIGVKRDYQKAAELFARSAPTDPEAQFLLSACYYKGHGVSKDIPQSMRLLQAASPYNNEANYMLAWFLHQGKYLTKDDHRANELLQIIINDKNALPEEIKKAKRLLRRLKL